MSSVSVSHRCLQYLQIGISTVSGSCSGIASVAAPARFHSHLIGGWQLHLYLTGACSICTSLMVGSCIGISSLASLLRFLLWCLYWYVSLSAVSVFFRWLESCKYLIGISMVVGSCIGIASLVAVVIMPSFVLHQYLNCGLRLHLYLICVGSISISSVAPRLWGSVSVSHLWLQPRYLNAGFHSCRYVIGGFEVSNTSAVRNSVLPGWLSGIIAQSVFW